MNLSIVSPVYGRQLDLRALHQRIVDAVAAWCGDFEIILVNDRSPDDAWDVIQDLARRDPRVRGVNLSRNFGQHCAITAGLHFVRGDWVVVMDCDLQDRPEEIPRLFAKAREGWDVVVGRRTERQDRASVNLTSKFFYVLFNYLTDQKLSHEVANFGVYSRKVIEAVKTFGERDRSFGLLVVLAGFRRCELEIGHAAREVGSSSYDFRKRLNMAFDLILSHSSKPLKLTAKVGFAVSVLSFLYAAFLVLRYFLVGTAVDGWTSLMVSQFFLFGVLTCVVGMVGLYVGKIHDQVKGRPLFIVDDKTF